MTTNSPNPVGGDVQALIADCQAEIAELEKALTTWGDAWIPSLQSKLNRQQVALAALTAEPVAWIVMTPRGDYTERNPDVVAHFEGTGLAKSKPLYETQPAQLLRPVELPPLILFGYTEEEMNVMCNVRNADIEAIRAAGYEVKS